MRPDLWPKVENLFHQAVDAPPGVRTGLLLAADPEVREEVQSLLLVEDSPEPQLQKTIQEETRAFVLTRERDWVGRRLGAWRVTRLVGTGGQGAVYEAERDDRQYRKRAAIKLIKWEHDNPISRMRFLRERQILATLEHPNIGRLLDGGTTEEDVPYLVMEYVDGVNIAEFARQEHLTVDDRLAIFRSAAAAVAYAHKKGVVHRDLKPCNILVTPDGTPHVLDFGIAKMLEDGTPQDGQATQLGSLLLTPDYASPEQVRGEPAAPASDIYSLGTILYELLTGVKAHHPDTYSPAGIYKAVCITPVVPPSKAAPKLRRRLRGDLDTLVLTALHKDVSRRYQSVDALVQDIDSYLAGRPLAARGDTVAYRAGKFVGRNRLAVFAGFMVVTSLAGATFTGAFIYRSQHSPKLTDKDTVVLGEFANRTGDTIFDDTLKQALSVSLRQSPYLNVLSDGRVADTLKLMTLPADTPLTGPVARDVCRRANGTAYVHGNIARLGSKYVLGLEAVDCVSGETLAQQQAAAANKEEVVQSLGDAVSKLREELGESLASVTKYDAPLIEETTASLEALKAESLGRIAEHSSGSTAAVPYFQRAIELDPNFARAYQSLGAMYGNLGQPARANEYLKKAYALRNRASERERLAIEAVYFDEATGETQKGIDVYQRWENYYPNDSDPWIDLSTLYFSLGEYEKSLEQVREAQRLTPDDVIIYEDNLASLLALNRFDEARTLVKDAASRKLADDNLEIGAYISALLDGNPAGMAQQAAWFASKPELEHEMLAVEAGVAASRGNVAQSRQLAQRAVEAAMRAKNPESAASWQLDSALREAVWGNLAEARRQARKALLMSRDSWDVELPAALVFAWTGDAAAATAMAKEVSHRLPVHTRLQSYWIPLVWARADMTRGTPTAALDHLEHVRPLDLASSPTNPWISCLYPSYLRGESYLAAGQPAQAVGEFQKILDHSGIAANCSTYSMAHLGLGRAYVKQQQFAKAEAEYEQFLGLWKGADGEVPVVRQARAEAQKLRRTTASRSQPVGPASSGALFDADR